MHTNVEHWCAVLLPSHRYFSPKKSFLSADARVKVGENLIRLASQPPIPYGKHHNNYLSNQVMDNIWLEIAQQPG